jgi:HSP20 family molecular chaperone IbpA
MDPRSAGSPWTEMRRLQHQMEHRFSGLSPALRRPLTGEYPPINVSRSDDATIVDAACPGIDRDKLEVTVRRFLQRVTLPDGVDVDRAHANVNRGVLTVRFPRTAPAAGRRIEVSAR